MSLVAKIAALLDALDPQDIDNLAPAERERFAAQLRHWSALAERKRTAV